MSTNNYTVDCRSCVGRDIPNWHINEMKCGCVAEYYYDYLDMISL